jgi:hypothetical protein
MDNRSAELSSWNQDQLIESLQSFDESLLKSVGFTDEALKTMIEKTHVEFDTTSKLNSAMFRVIVENLDERQQLLLINNLESQGFNCKAMMM